MTILDQYVTSAPSPQNAIDIFAGEWASALPDSLGKLKAGQSQLFNDVRIHWAEQELGGFKGATVLELGPLEAAHTCMMEQYGAAEILAIEANTRAYLKCLTIKELFELKRSKFVCGDFVEFLRQNSLQFDICVASGVLYHMRNPVELISLISKVCDRVMIWTHYYDADLMATSDRFPESHLSEYQGFEHRLYRQEYGVGLDLTSFCGGNDSYSNWMSRADILNCLQHFGFSEIQINFEDSQNPNGPSFCLAAVKNTSQGSLINAKVDQLKQQIQTLEQQQQQTKQYLQQARQQIEAMKTSKFWKIRQSWFAFKKTFGLPSNES